MEGKEREERAKNAIIKAWDWPCFYFVIEDCPQCVHKTYGIL